MKTQTEKKSFNVHAEIDNDRKERFSALQDEFIKLENEVYRLGIRIIKRWCHVERRYYYVAVHNNKLLRTNTRVNKFSLFNVDELYELMQRCNAYILDMETAILGMETAANVDVLHIKKQFSALYGVFTTEWLRIVNAEHALKKKAK